jgi:hypothetical protein
MGKAASIGQTHRTGGLVAQIHADA